MAARKAASLIDAGADVTVISPALNPALEAALSEGRISLVRRKFRPSDLEGAELVLAATDDSKVNRAVSRASRCALVNVADDPSLCTFIVPSIIRRGAFTIAISTGGASPAAAKAMRLKIEAALGEGAIPPRAKKK